MANNLGRRLDRIAAASRPGEGEWYWWAWGPNPGDGMWLSAGLHIASEPVPETVAWVRGVLADAHD